jgi:hypothetical protein
LRHNPHTVKMLFFGGLIYSKLPPSSCPVKLPLLTLQTVSCLLLNAIAILSEDRFLARSKHNLLPFLRLFLDFLLTSDSAVNLSSSSFDPAFGQSAADNSSVKAKVVNLITSVRTLMRIPLIVVNTLIIVYELVLG